MDSKKYKIGVVGLGPVGLIIAQNLKDAGCEVAICDVIKEKVNLIRNNGIELVGIVEKKSYFNYVFSSLKDLLDHEVDILICAVKAYHVDYILDYVRDSNNCDDMLVVSAQNGIGVAEKYTSHFHESRIFRMVINFAGNLFAPNVVNVTFFNPPNYIASRDDSKEDVSKWIAGVLSSVGLTTKSTDSFSLANQIWQKTILNAALSPLCAISKFTMKEAMDFPHTNEIVEKLIMEAVEVAKAEEIKLEDNFVKLCMRYLKKAGSHFPSLAVDLMNNRETEIDYMNGKIVAFGRKHYIRTPLHLTFTNLVRAISEKNLRNTKPYKD